MENLTDRMIAALAQNFLPARIPSYVEFRQHAAGSFSPTVIPGTSYCGIGDTHDTFRYDIEICYRGGMDVLDANGFLLDNTDFQHYFDSLMDIAISCERLAHQACAHFAHMLTDRLHNVKSICVKVFPFGEVFVEAKLSNE